MKLTFIIPFLYIFQTIVAQSSSPFSKLDLDVSINNITINNTPYTGIGYNLSTATGFL